MGSTLRRSYPFLGWLENTLFVFAGTLAMTLAVSLAAAYALGRLRPPGFRWWRRAIFATYVIPQTILFVPLYRVVIGLGLDDNLLALLLVYPTMALPFCVWLLSAYFQHLPREIEEAALIEGASRATAFFRIILPMSRPVLVASGIFTLGTVASDFMIASIFLLSGHNQTIPAGLGTMEVALDELAAVAGINLMAIPVILICALFARGYVRGLSAMVEGRSAADGGDGRRDASSAESHGPFSPLGLAFRDPPVAANGAERGGRAPSKEGGGLRDGPLSAAGGEAEDAVVGGFGDVERARAVEHDSAGIAQLGGDDADLSRRRDPEDLSDLKPAAHVHAAVGSDRQVGSMVVPGGESGDETERAIGPEPQHFPDGTQEDEIVARRRHADESPQRLSAGAGPSALREDRHEQVGAARERPLLVDIQAENYGPPVAFLREPVERRRKGRLGSKMRLRTRVVDEDQPPPRVEGDRAPPEEMVQPHRHHL